MKYYLLLYFKVGSFIHFFPGQSVQKMSIANMSSIGYQSDLKLISKERK